MGGGKRAGRRGTGGGRCHGSGAGIVGGEGGRKKENGPGEGGGRRRKWTGRREGEGERAETAENRRSGGRGCNPWAGGSPRGAPIRAPPVRGGAIRPFLGKSLARLRGASLLQSGGKAGTEGGGIGGGREEKEGGAGRSAQSPAREPPPRKGNKCDPLPASTFRHWWRSPPPPFKGKGNGKLSGRPPGFRVSPNQDSPVSSGGAMKPPSRRELGRLLPCITPPTHTHNR